MYNKIVNENSDGTDLDDISSSHKLKAFEIRKCKNNKKKKQASNGRSLRVCNTLLTYTIKYYVRIVKTKFWKDCR